MAVKLPAWVERILRPRLSACYRCHRPFAWDGDWIGVPAHFTEYASVHEGERACFPICESCWTALSPVERIPFYDILIDWWAADGLYTEDEMNEIRKSIHDAVLAGL